jgi:hypothetical protein
MKVGRRQGFRLLLPLTEATNFNHVKNQSRGHAKKVECSSTFMACPRALRRTKNAQVKAIFHCSRFVRAGGAGFENLLTRA